MNGPGSGNHSSRRGPLPCSGTREDPSVLVSTRIPRSQRDELDKIASVRGVTRGQLVRLLIEKELSRLDGREPGTDSVESTSSEATDTNKTTKPSPLRQATLPGVEDEPEWTPERARAELRSRIDREGLEEVTRALGIIRSGADSVEAWSKGRRPHKTARESMWSAFRIPSNAWEK